MVHWCWDFTAHLYEEQILIGVIALTQACCQAVLQSSTEQWEFCQGQCCGAMVLG